MQQYEIAQQSIYYSIIFLCIPYEASRDNYGSNKNVGTCIKKNNIITPEVLYCENNKKLYFKKSHKCRISFLKWTNLKYQSVYCLFIFVFLK